MKNPKVNIKNITNLSNEWYKLDKVNFDYQLKNVNGKIRIERVMIVEMELVFYFIIQ